MQAHTRQQQQLAKHAHQGLLLPAFCVTLMRVAKTTCKHSTEMQHNSA
jgi:hypothetical protein